MNNLIYSLVTLLWILGCSNPKPNHLKLVADYYDAWNASDYNQIKALIADSLTTSEGEYLTTFSHASFHEHFKWDSVFQTRYELVKVDTTNNQVMATVSSTSLRFAFLKNNPLTCSSRISFKGGKISRIEYLDCENADWTVWTKEVDTLVAWIKKNHPELDGFIHDLTMQGAINYLKAIEFYEQQR